MKKCINELVNKINKVKEAKNRKISTDFKYANFNTLFQ